MPGHWTVLWHGCPNTETSSQADVLLSIVGVDRVPGINFNATCFTIQTATTLLVITAELDR